MTPQSSAFVMIVTGSLTRDAGAQADIFLSAMVGFMKSIIPNVDTSLAATISTTSEGKALVRALTDYVMLIVNPQPPEIEMIILQPVTTNEMEPSSRLGGEEHMGSEIPGKIYEKTRVQVVNRMPRRLLMFDANGANIKIISRNDVIEDIRSRATRAATEEKFQADWYSCAEDPDIRSCWRRQDELIEKLLTQHSARYAILSHRWLQGQDGEVQYEDWAKRERNPEGPGYHKIRKFCEIAAVQYGVSYGWMDTVCIDKTSSTELDESIRSMYKWYRYAHVCIAYMADTTELSEMQSDSWFSRGWTLQELAAPKNIQFYNKNWEGFTETQIGFPEPLPLFTSDSMSPSDSSIRDSVLDQVTAGAGISRRELALFHRGQVEMVSISRKFGLAATRNVTIQEDEVYSLMGLFGVEIPVAYGEGAGRALYRLQRELLNTHKNVLDIFNCAYIPDSNSEVTTLQKFQSLPISITQYLGRSDAFDPSDKYSKFSSLLDIWRPVQALSSTHLGLYVPLLLFPALVKQHQEGYSPKGLFSGRCFLTQSENEVLQYNMLDYHLYDDTQEIDTQSPSNIPSIVFFAVLNFTIDNGTVHVPVRGLGIPLHCGSMKPGEVHQADDIKIIASTRAPVCAIKSATEKYSALQTELSDHGIQFITLYV